VIDMNGNLGTVASSERFKTEIRPMDQTSEAILSLRPVTINSTSLATRPTGARLQRRPSRFTVWRLFVRCDFASTRAFDKML